MKEEMEQLKAQVIELTRVMTEKAQKGQDVEVKELSDKLAALQKEVGERKVRFADGSTTSAAGMSKAAEKKLDELFIASALLTKKDGTMDAAAFADIKALPEYRDAVKDAGLVFAPGTLINETVSTHNGADFVPYAFSATLLEEIWLKLEVANLFNRFTMTAPQFIFPFAPDRIKARLGKEATAPTKDAFTTAQIIFNAKKIMSNVDFSDEIEADSIVSILPLVRQKLIEGFALGQELIVLNGDTTVGAGNVNGTLAGAPDDVRLATKGLRALAGANSNNYALAGGALAAGTTGGDNIRMLRTKMGKYGKNPSDLAIICSMQDYNAMLGFAGYQALYQYAGAVTTAGELGRIDNIPIIVTELLPSTANGSTAGVNASGIVDATPANNTKNIIGLVNKNGYMWGDRKAFSLETFRNPYSQTTSLIGSQRLDFQTILPGDPCAVFGVNY